MLAQQLVAATGPLARLLAECARRVQALREWYRTTAAAAPEARATALLREWLSPQQRAQFDTEGYFDVVGCDSGKRYRIHHGTSMNVHEIDDAGHSKSGWCFVPNRRLAAGDVMLAQKIGLRRFVEVYMTQPCQPIANALAKYKTAGLDLPLKCNLRPGTKANRDV
jgi:hypothetical protein